MRSMTGFGNASVSDDEFELDISVRAVNGRFLDLRFHLPREYAGFESEFKGVLQKTYSRGTVDIYMNRRPGAGGDTTDIAVRGKLARRWLAAYRQLAHDLKLKGDPTLELVARVPDVIKVQDSVKITSKEKKAALGTLQSALTACDRERQREGKALNSELQRLLGQLEELVGSMESVREEANAELEKRYRERLQKLGFAGIVEDQRLAQEIVMQLDRADITEEISRLREHLKAYRQLFKSNEPQGKKMDFYAQELLREVNTIGSKSQVAHLTRLVVDAKTLVERVREQVQNVE